jgi:hypothetical protein
MMCTGRPLLIVAIVLGIAGSGWAADPSGVKYAIVIGVGEYEHPRFRPLKFAENDVAELGQTLEAGGFRVTQLSDTPGARDARLKPNRGNILRELDRVLAACTKRDLVLIALSGHGLQPSGSKENFFCPADARAQDLATLIGMSDLYERLDRSAAEVKLILADACRDDPVAGKGITKVPLPPEGVGVLLSCSPGEQAYESKEFKHGVFYYFLLDGLKNRKAMNDEKKITFGLLAEYVQRRVARTVPTMIGDGAKQSPNLVVNISGESPVLLTPEVNSRKPAPDPIPAPSPASGKPAAAQLVGSWAANNEAIFFHNDRSVVLTMGPMYLKGVFSCDNGILDMSFTDINWDLRINVDWMEGQNRKVLGQVLETNMPGFKIGHRFGWQRTGQAEPPPPPTRQELLGSWAGDGVVYTMNPDHSFIVQFNGGQMRGRYAYGGNLLLVKYIDMNWLSTGVIAWADPMTRTTIRSTVLFSTIPNAPPAGTRIDFRRVR